MNYDKYDLMTNSLMKNIQELSEHCVDNGVKNAYDLMDIVSFYSELLEKAKNNNGKVMVKMESD